MRAVTHKRLMWVLLGIVLAVLGAGVAAMFVPVAQSVKNPVATHWRFAFSLMLTTAFSASAIWYMIGLRQFKTRMRRAYTLIGVGLLIFSAAMLQLAVIGLLDLWDSAWATGGGVILIFMLALVFTYAGIRQFARLLGVGGPLTSFWVVVGSSVFTAVAGGLAATLFIRYELDGIEVYVAAVSWTVGYLLASTMLARKISLRIGVRYSRAMRWQTIALGAFLLSGVHEVISTILMSDSVWYEAYGVYLWPFVVTGLLFVYASYEFSLLTAREEAVGAGDMQATDGDYIDSLVAVAALASNSQDVDPMIDDMRLVTSNLAPGQPLTGDQKQRLVAVYAKLEAYLTSKDPLRTYTAEEVREQVTPGFQTALAQYRQRL